MANLFKIIKNLNSEQFGPEDSGKPSLMAEKVKRGMITAVATVLCLFHLYTSGFGSLSTLDQRLVHWTLMFILIFLFYPSKSKFGQIVDFLLIAISIVVAAYLYIAWRNVSITGTGTRTNMEILFGVLAVFVTMVATKRTCGWALPAVAAVFLLYLFFGQHLPFIGHRGYSLNRIVSIIYFGSEGIFGTAIGVSSTIIIIFVMFGSFLSYSGGGKAFMDISFAITGRYRGGAAKASVLGSALVGTVTGSPIANVMTTGIFTIPLMKKTGYQGHVAGAVEAIASTGGQILPPVMGAAAFIMAEFLAIPYAQVCWAALIPALLYFISIFVIVDVEASKKGIRGLGKEDLPMMGKVMKEGWSALVPLVVLFVLILSNFSVNYSVFYSVILLLAIWFIRLRFNIKEFIKQLPLAFVDTAKNAGSVVAACACAGIIVGTIQLTGIGLKLCSYIEIIADGQLLLALVMAMAVSIVLGLGLPTTVLYIILSAIVAPALINLGAPRLAAHLFIFYFGCMSSVTPPVPLAAFAAASIAKESFFKIGWTALRFGLVAFIVPYMFMYSPALLFEGAWYEILQAFVTSVIGTIALAHFIQGWLLSRKTNILIRLGLLASAVLLIKQGGTTDLIGIAILAICILVQLVFKRKDSNQNKLMEVGGIT